MTDDVWTPPPGPPAAGPEVTAPAQNPVQNPAQSSPNVGDTADNPPDTADNRLDTSETPGDTAAESPGPPAKSDNRVTNLCKAPLAGTNPGRCGREAGHTGRCERNYDWPRVRARYVEGTRDSDGQVHLPTMADVANHFGLPLNRIKEKAAQEGWTGQRQAWQARQEAVRQQARLAGLAKDGMLLDNRALEAAKLGMQLCIAQLGAIGQAAQEKRSRGGGQGTTLIDAQEQQRLAQAVDMWHKIGLRAIGDPETTRIEVTGAAGGPIEIAQELRRDDPNRIAGVLAVLASAGLGDVLSGVGVDTAGALETRRGDDGVYETEPAGG